MKKIWVIIKREYIVRVRTKAFLIGTIASPMIMLALIILPTFLAGRGGGERLVTVLDQSADPGLFEAINRRVESRTLGSDSQDRDADGPQATRFVLSRRVVPPDQDIQEFITRDYNETGEKNSDRSYLVLSPGILDSAEPQYYAKNLSDFSLGTFRQAVSAAISERRLLRAGFDANKISNYMKPIPLKTIKIDGAGEFKEGGARQDFMVAFALLFFLYISVLFYGLFVMRGVIEEKQSRIVEVVISSVKPLQMMLGKLIGIGLVGLTQISIWAITAGLISMFGARLFAAQGASIPNIPLRLLVYFVVYFILGYFLYATLYAIVGAMVSSEEDAQQIQFPVTMLIIVPMLIFGLIMANPNSGSSIALSMVPFFAPTLMMLRIAVSNPPLWQILLSMTIMLASILGAVWVAARIYRVGILMYGKRPSLVELGRWLRYSS